MGIDLGKGVFEAFGDMYMEYRGHYIKTKMTFEKAKEIFDKKQNENNELKKQNSQLEAKVSKLQSEIDKCNKATTILMGSEYHNSPSTVITELQNMVRDFQEQMAKSIVTAKGAEASVRDLEALKLMPKELTAENGAKHLLNGEFKEKAVITCFTCQGMPTDDYGDVCEDCGGAGDYAVDVPVTWTTIKDIYKKVYEHFVLNPPESGEK